MRLRCVVLSLLVTLAAPGAASAQSGGPLPASGGLAELTAPSTCAVPPGSLDNDGNTQTACQVLAPLLGVGPTVASADGRFVYVAGGTDSSTIFGHGMGYGGLLVLARDPATHALTRVQCLGSDTSDGAGETACDPLTAAIAPTGIALSPDGSLVALVASGSGSLTLLQRDAQTGRLAEIGCAQENIPYSGRCRAAPVLEGVAAVTFSPDGKDIYAASPYRSAVLQVRQEEDGSLTRRCLSVDGTSGGCGRAPQLVGPASVRVTADGRFLYSLTQRGVTWLTRDLQTGALAPGGCVVPDTGAPCGGGRDGDSTTPGYGRAPQLAWSADDTELLVSMGYADDARVRVLTRSAGDGTLRRGGCLEQTPYEEPVDEETDATDEEDGLRAAARQTSASGCGETPVLPYGGAMLALSDGRFLVSGYGTVTVVALDGDVPRAQGCLAFDDNRCAPTRMAGTTLGGVALPDGGALLTSFGLWQLTPAPTVTARASGAAVRVRVACPSSGACRASGAIRSLTANLRRSVAAPPPRAPSFRVAAGGERTLRLMRPRGAHRAAASVLVRAGGRTFGVVAPVAGLGGLAPAVAPASCPAGRLLARRDRVQVRRTGAGATVACLAGARPVILDRVGAKVAGPVALAGRFAAFALVADAGHGATHTSMAVVDLRRGTLRQLVPAASQPIGSAVAALVVKASGAVAWAACAPVHGRCPGGRGDELHLEDASGSRVAVRARRRITGLRLDGSRLHFQVAGGLRELSLA